MTPANFLRDVEEAFDLYLDDTIARGEQLYHLDGEIAFRHCAGRIETWAHDEDSYPFD